MSDSLVQQISAFEGLHWGQILVLVSVLNECELRTEWHIENRYKERASSFAQTLTFLTGIGLIKRSSGELLLDDPPPETQSSAFRWMILECIMLSGSTYLAEVSNFLGKFEPSDGRLSYRSSEGTRSKESAVRNFLMEVGVVNYSQQEDRYAVAPEYTSFYARVRQESERCLPSKVTASVENRDELGLAAEEAVIEYEKKRVGINLANRVEHVALRNSAAGYDILSVTASGDASVTMRFIEVKAVSMRTFQFFWTQNEVQVSRLLGSLYYLYLLPVRANGELCIDRLVIVCDPYSSVIGNAEEWITETSVLRCSTEAHANSARSAR